MITQMSNQELVALITRRRLQQNDLAAVTAWRKHGGEANMTFSQFSKIDPRREIEEREEAEARNEAARIKKRINSGVKTR